MLLFTRSMIRSWYSVFFGCTRHGFVPRIIFSSQPPLSQCAYCDGGRQYQRVLLGSMRWHIHNGAYAKLNISTIMQSVILCVALLINSYYSILFSSNATHKSQRLFKKSMRFLSSVQSGYSVLSFIGKSLFKNQSLGIHGPSGHIFP